MATKRIFKELAEFNKDPPPNFAANAEPSNPFEWSVYMIGPPDTPYEEGVFSLKINLPEDYPFKPPKKVTFETKIYHPNVSSKGEYYPCRSNWNLLDPNQWYPALEVIDVLKQINGHLITPSTACCSNSEALKVYLEDRTRYEAIAKDWTLRHAS